MIVVASNRFASFLVIGKGGDEGQFFQNIQKYIVCYGGPLENQLVEGQPSSNVLNENEMK